MCSACGSDCLNRLHYVAIGLECPFEAQSKRECRNVRCEMRSERECRKYRQTAYACIVTCLCPGGWNVLVRRLLFFPSGYPMSSLPIILLGTAVLSSWVALCDMAPPVDENELSMLRVPIPIEYDTFDKYNKFHSHGTTQTPLWQPCSQWRVRVVQHTFAGLRRRFVCGFHPFKPTFRADLPPAFIEPELTGVR